MALGAIAQRSCADLSVDDLQTLYRLMLLTRILDTRIRTLYLQGKIFGGVYSELGHEAIAVGSAYALQPDDILMPQHRDLGAHITRGLEPRRILAQILGRATGFTSGKDNALHIGDVERHVLPMISMLGTNVPVTAGAALALKMRGERRVALTYTGDGGINTADVHEGLNFAAVLRLPLVLVVENNQYAYSTPTSKQYAMRAIVDRAQGYGIPGEQVDGNDVLAVYFTVHDAVERARAGFGPTLIEAITMRMRGHSEQDRADYVPRELLTTWAERDPLTRLARLLADEGIMSEEAQQALQIEVAAEVDEAVAWAEAQPLPGPQTAHEGVYAETSLY
jgi:TPP-dependent pyruvate/acetoin dehydrogenase alpha subunit